MKEFSHFEVFANDQFMPGYRKWLDQLYEKTVATFDIKAETWLDIIIQLDEQNEDLLEILKDHSKPTYFRPFYYMLQLDADSYTTSNNNLKLLAYHQVAFDDLSTCFGFDRSENMGFGLVQSIHGDHLRPGASWMARRDMAVSLYLEMNPKEDIYEYFDLDFTWSPDSNALSAYASFYALAEIGIDVVNDKRIPCHIRDLMSLNMLDIPADKQADAIKVFLRECGVGPDINPDKVSSSLGGLATAILERSTIRLLDGHEPTPVYNAMMACCDAFALVTPIEETRLNRLKDAMTKALFIHLPDLFVQWCPNTSFDELWQNGKNDFNLPLNPSTLVRSVIMEDKDSMNSSYAFLKVLRLAHVPINKDNLKRVFDYKKYELPELINQMKDDEDILIPEAEKVLIDMIINAPDDALKIRYPFDKLTIALKAINGPDAQIALMVGLAQCKKGGLTVPDNIRPDLSNPSVKTSALEYISAIKDDNHRHFLEVSGLTYKDFKESRVALPDALKGSLLTHQMSL